MRALQQEVARLTAEVAYLGPRAEALVLENARLVKVDLLPLPPPISISSRLQRIGYSLELSPSATPRLLAPFYVVELGDGFALRTAIPSSFSSRLSLYCSFSPLSRSPCGAWVPQELKVARIEASLHQHTADKMARRLLSSERTQRTLQGRVDGQAFQLRLGMKNSKGTLAFPPVFEIFLVPS